MRDHKLTPSQDIAAFKQDMNTPHIAAPPLTPEERNDELFPKPLVKVVNTKTGDVIQGILGAAQ